MSEPDSVVMAAGMARMAAGEEFSACLLYGRFLNPGIYLLFKLIHPLFVRTASDTIPFLNWLGVVSSSLLAALLYLLFRRAFDRTVSVCCALIAMFTPVFWETGTYFHPVVPALALLAGAMLLFDRISFSPGGISALMAVIALSTAATVMRNEVVLAVPALLAAAALSPRPRRNTCLVALISAVSALVFIAVARAVSATDAGGGMLGFSGRFSGGYLGSISFRGLLRTVPWAVMATGTATVALAAWGTLVLFRSPDDRDAEDERRIIGDILPALLWAAPALIIWLLWPVPVMRHYFIAVPALVYLLGAFVLSGRRRGAILSITVAVIVLNLGLPEILYRTYNTVYPHSAKEPHGTFFYRHSRVEDRIDRYRVLQNEISNRADDHQGSDHGCVILPVNWEIYGYTIYCLAGRAERTGVSDDPVTGIVTHDFETAGSSIRLIFSSRFDFDVISDELLHVVEKSAGPGCIVYLPREVEGSALEKLSAPVEIAVY